MALNGWRRNSFVNAVFNWEPVEWRCRTGVMGLMTGVLVTIRAAASSTSWSSWGSPIVRSRRDNFQMCLFEYKLPVRRREQRNRKAAFFPRCEVAC